MHFLSELRHLFLLFLVLRIQELIVSVQVVKIIGLLVQLLVELPASAVFPIFLLPEFFLDPFYLCFCHPPEFLLFL